MYVRGGKRLEIWKEEKRKKVKKKKRKKGKEEGEDENKHQLCTDYYAYTGKHEMCMLSTWVDASPNGSYSNLSYLHCLSIAYDICTELRMETALYDVYVPYVMYMLCGNKLSPSGIGVLAEKALDPSVCKKLRDGLNEGVYRSRTISHTTLEEDKASLVSLWPLGFYNTKKNTHTLLHESSVEMAKMCFLQENRWMEHKMMEAFFECREASLYSVHQIDMNTVEDVLRLHSVFRILDCKYPNHHILRDTLILTGRNRVHFAVRRDIMELVRCYFFFLYPSKIRRWPLLMRSFLTMQKSKFGLDRCVDHAVMRFLMLMLGFSKKGITDFLAPVSGVEFDVYYLLPRILSKYTSLDMMNADFCNQTGRNGQTLHRAVFSFMCVGKNHTICPEDAMRLVLMIRAKNTFSPGDHREALDELTVVAKLLVPGNRSTYTKRVKVNHIRMYRLCASGVLHAREALDLFLALCISEMAVESAEGNSVCSRNNNRFQSSQSNNQLLATYYEAGKRDSGIKLNDMLVDEQQKDELLDHSQALCWFMNAIENLSIGYSQRNAVHMQACVKVEDLLAGNEMRFFMNDGDECDTYGSVFPMPKINNRALNRALSTHGGALKELTCYFWAYCRVLDRNFPGFSRPLSAPLSCGDGKINILGKRISYTESKFGGSLLPYDILMGNVYFSSGSMSSGSRSSKFERRMRAKAPIIWEQ